MTAREIVRRTYRTLLEMERAGVSPRKLDQLAQWAQQALPGQVRPGIIQPKAQGATIDEAAYFRGLRKEAERLGVVLL